LRYTEKKSVEGAMICIDFRKAFDTIRRDFILFAFEKFNFGLNMLKWITTMFKNTVSCILHNGHMSKFFFQEEGLRQGCNLSPLFFIIAAEIMSSKIRQVNDYTGY